MKKRFRIDIPLTMVKPICILGVMMGIFFLAAGLWIAGLCMVLGSYILEKNTYRCPKCRRNLDMKHPLMKGSRCPFCGELLRK